MHADDVIYTRVRNGVVVVSGTGPAIRIDGGRLVIRDGPKETPPLCLTRAEASRQLRHVIVCGDFGGYVTFDALRWLRDTGVAFSHSTGTGPSSFPVLPSPITPHYAARKRWSAAEWFPEPSPPSRAKSCQPSLPDKREWQDF